MKHIREINEKRLREAADTLHENHGLFLHHTGNMFGVGCVATDPVSITRLNELKQRPSGKGFILLFQDPEDLYDYRVQLSKTNRRLLEQYSPGNVSFVMPCSDERIRMSLTDNSLAARIPLSPLLRAFIGVLRAPVISTSVNSSGEAPLTKANDIRKRFGNQLSFSLYFPEEESIPPRASTLVKLGDGEPEVLRQGIVPYYEIVDSYRSPLLLFVCTGNICRSPMAEYYARSQAKKLSIPVRTASAGFLSSGIGISNESWRVLQEAGIDAGEHLSQGLSWDLVRRSWKILTMTEQHKKDLQNRFPIMENKVETLSEATDLSGDIQDPYGQSPAEYDEAFRKIRLRIDILLKSIQGEFTT